MSHIKDALTAGRILGVSAQFIAWHRVEGCTYPCLHLRRLMYLIGSAVTVALSLVRQVQRPR